MLDLQLKKYPLLWPFIFAIQDLVTVLGSSIVALFLPEKMPGKHPDKRLAKRSRTKHEQTNPGRH